MANYIRKMIPVVDVLLDPQNPRFDPIHHQREAYVNQIDGDNGKKLVNLARNIVEKGLDPMEVFVVTGEGAEESNQQFVVREGNRRLTVLKLLNNPALLNSLPAKASVKNKLLDLVIEFKNSPITEVECAVFEEYNDEVKYWLELKHTGENEGAGRSAWDSRAKRRFKGGTPGTQAIDLIKANVRLTDAEITEIDKPGLISTIERMLTVTPEVRRKLGFDVIDDTLVMIGSPVESLSNITQMILDVAAGRQTSRKLNRAEDRIRYAEELSSTAPKRKLLRTFDNTSGEVHSNTKAPKSDDTKPIRRTAATKKRLKLEDKRAEKIYEELQRLSIEKFPNASAILIRVFVEFGVDAYGKTHNLEFRPKDQKTGKPIPDKWLKLKEKLDLIIKHMEAAGIDKKILSQVRTLRSDPDSILYYERLHDYVHNPHYAPIPEQLVTIWNNLEAFIHQLWAPKED